MLSQVGSRMLARYGPLSLLSLRRNMCGRFSLITPIEALRRAFSFAGDQNLAPRYNIAPSQPVAVIQRDRERPQLGAFLNHMQWGLVPSWAKDVSIGYKMINARAETAHEKPSFRQAWRRRRCLIPADGFYEWRSEGGGKQPYRIAFQDNRPFTFAGLYEHWMGPDGSELTTCSILTTVASDFLMPVHHRMPVILPLDRHSAWLDPDQPYTEDILQPFSDPLLEFYPVSRDVNKPANDHAGLLEPIDVAETDETLNRDPSTAQGSLF